MSELAWAAGFFDGEGNTRLHRCTPNGRGNPDGYSSLLVQISQHYDRTVLDRFSAAVGVGRVHGPYHYEYTGAAARFNFQCHGDDARTALRAIWPWLGTRKREQAVAAGFAADAREEV